MSIFRVTDDPLTNDLNIQELHKNWLNHNVPTWLDVSPLTADSQFSVLKYPKLWESKRLFGTKFIADEGPIAAYNFIKQALANKEKEDSSKIADIKKFKEFYKKYFFSLKNKAFMHYINGLIGELKQEPRLNPTELEEIKRLLSNTYLLQTRYHCLARHGQIMRACKRLKSKIATSSNGLHSKLEKLEFFCTSVITNYYGNVKKLTFDDAIGKNISFVIKAIVACLTVALLGIGIAALIYQIWPLILAGLIISAVCFALTNTAITMAVVKMFEEGAYYKLYPKLSTLIGVVFRSFLNILSISFGYIVSAIGQLVNAAPHIINFVVNISDTLNNGIGSIFEFFSMAKLREAKKLAPFSFIFTEEGKLKNTDSATSLSALRDHLMYQDDAVSNKAINIVAETKNYLKTLPPQPVEPVNRGFFFTHLNVSENSSRFFVKPSKQATILTLANKIKRFTMSNEAKEVVEAVEDYEKLAVNVPRKKRVDALGEIKNKCKAYKKARRGQGVTTRQRLIETLEHQVDEERQALSAIPEFENSAPILVSHSISRP